MRILVEDRDDNAPVFYPGLYNVSLGEEAAVAGLPLLLVSASDADSGAFADVAYALDAGSPAADRFRIDAESGELYVEKPLSVGAYKLVVTATDGGGLSALAPAVVNVNVLPDAALSSGPAFAQKIYRFSVREDTLPDIAIGRVAAVSAGPVTYAIYSGDPEGLFVVSEASGEVLVKEYLDADTRPSLLLNIQASSGNPPVFNHTQVC